jgi:protein-S-isoprenylcysteine O-methyltransferase Ste14
VSSLPSLGPRGEGWVVIQFILLFAIFAAGLVEPPLAGPAWTVVSAAGVAVTLAGGLLAVLGVLHLGRSLTPLPHPRDGAELVEDGVYRVVRHPIYGGLVIGSLGYGLVMRAPLAGMVGALALLGFFRLKSAREEAWLEHRYSGYPAYRARTRRMLPFLY